MDNPWKSVEKTKKKHKALRYHAHPDTAIHWLLYKQKIVDPNKKVDCSSRVPIVPKK